MQTHSVEYHTFVSSLLGDFNRVEALVCGVDAIHDRHRDDGNLDDVYSGELLRLVRGQLAAMRDRIDGSTYAFTMKGASKPGEFLRANVFARLNALRENGVIIINPAAVKIQSEDANCFLEWVAQQAKGATA